MVDFWTVKNRALFFLCIYRKYEDPLMNGGLFSASRGKPHQSTTNQPVKAHWEYTIVQIYNKNPPRLWISAIHYYNPMGFHGDTRIPFGSFWHLPQVPSSWRCLRIVPSSSTRNAQCRWVWPGAPGGKTRCTSTRWFGRQWRRSPQDKGDSG